MQHSKRQNYLTGEIYNYVSMLKLVDQKGQFQHGVFYFILMTAKIILRVKILAGSSLLTLLDDIATLLDDISVMGKLAAKNRGRAGR